LLPRSAAPDSQKKRSFEQMLKNTAALVCAPYEMGMWRLWKAALRPDIPECSLSAVLADPFFGVSAG